MGMVPVGPAAAGSWSVFPRRAAPRVESSAMRRLLAMSMVGGVLALVLPDLACAQGAPTASPTAPTRGRAAREALEAFETGTRAAEEARWSDALPAFERAYALSRSDIALFNIGYVLRALGRFVEAHRAFSEVIERSGGTGGLLDEARTYRNEVLGRIAHLRIDGLAPERRHSILLDGTAREDDGSRPLELSLDPGDHGLSVRLDGFLPFDWAGHLAEGATDRASVTLVPIPSAGTVADEAWFWLVMAGVAAAGAIAIGFVVDDAVQLDPAPGRAVVRL